MSIDDWLRLVQIGVILASAGLNVYLFRKSRHIAQIKELQSERKNGDAALHKRLDTMSTQSTRQSALSVSRDAQLTRRISVIENTIAHMPTHKDLTGIRAELSNINSNVTALGERSKSNNEMLQSIQKHLMGLET